MNAKAIAIASDHAGFPLKQELKGALKAWGYEVLDLGTHNGDSVDYPDFGDALAEAIANAKAPRGLLVCGTGIGISIAANRNPCVRAALCHDVTTARLARQHNDANVLVLGSRIVGPSVAMEALEAFLNTHFEGGRHARRVEKLGR